MEKYLVSGELPLLLFVVAGLTWVVFAYWYIKLIRRVNVVARTQHPIPENIRWIKKARLAIETDVDCQVLERKRNIAAITFFVVMAVEGAILAITVILVE